MSHSSNVGSHHQIESAFVLISAGNRIYSKKMLARVIISVAAEHFETYIKISFLTWIWHAAPILTIMMILLIMNA